MQPKQPLLSNSSPGGKALSLLAIWLVCFGVFNMIGAGLLAVKFGFSGVTSLKQAANAHPDLLNWVKLVQTVISIGAFVLPALVFSYLETGKPFHFSTLDRRPGLLLSVISVIIIITAAPLIMWVLYVNQAITFPESLSYLEESLRAMEKNGEALMEALIIMDSPFDLFVNMVMIALVPAIGEELLFRGTLQKVLTNLWHDPHLAIFVSGCIFSGFHLQFYGFFPRFMLGVIFGYMFWWSGKIWLPIFAHFIHNGVQVSLIYLNEHGFISTDIETIETAPWHMVLIGTILLIFSLRKFYKLSLPPKIADQHVE